MNLSHYRLVKKIGEGGTGVVWKALDTKTRPVRSHPQSKSLTVLGPAPALDLRTDDAALSVQRRSQGEPS